MQQEAIDQLTRIADALEGIETRLDALEELQDTAEQLRECIGYERPARYAPPGSKGFNFLRIGGTVYKGLPETVTPLYILNARAGAFGKDTPT